jgi:predicted dehydrogenase
MNWGVIGFGEITPSFIESILALEGQNLFAIASKSKFKFLREKKIYSEAIIYSEYQHIYNDPNIDIVYVSTTNNLHKENVLFSLRSDKHVLCEKPLSKSKEDTLEIIRTAKQHNKFLMEAMWTRFLPAYKEFITLIKNGAIGSPKMAFIDFGFLSTWGPERRLLNKKLFGGAILDNTDYGIFLCIDIFGGLPKKIHAVGHFSKTEVEDMCGILLSFPGGEIAHLFSSFTLKTNQDAIVYGDKGNIIFKEFWHGTKIILQQDGKEPVCFDIPSRYTGFFHEIEETSKCIENGFIESSIIPHQLSVDVAGIMDEVISLVSK